MRKGFAPIILGLSYLNQKQNQQLESNNNVSSQVDDSTTEHTPFNPTIIPTESDLKASSSPSTKCPINQIGNIKYNPPPNWKKIDEINCHPRYLSPGEEENFYNHPKKGALITISSNKNLVITDDCKAFAGEDTYVKPIKCTNLKGNKLDIYNIDYEGHYLIYLITYKNNYYEFRLGSNEETKYKPVIEQIVYNLEFL